VQIVLLCGSDRSCVVYIELYRDHLIGNVLVGDCVQIGNVLVGDCVQIVCKNVNYSFRGADKSLARPERKRSTATEGFVVHVSYL
jgi:hypothetical protein